MNKKQVDSSTQLASFVKKTTLVTELSNLFLNILDKALLTVSQYHIMF